jgi:signal transduction histidine kinase
LYFENKKTFTKEKKEIEEKYILKNKEIIKEEVTKVYEFTKRLQKNTEEELKQNVKNRVYEAHAIASSIYENYKDTKTKKEIFELIKVAFDKIRFNDGRGYFFMDDTYGNKLSHPVDKSIEGKNFIDYTDATKDNFIIAAVPMLYHIENGNIENFYFGDAQILQFLGSNKSPLDEYINL